MAAVKGQDETNQVDKREKDDGNQLKGKPVGCDGDNNNTTKVTMMKVKTQEKDDVAGEDEYTLPTCTQTTHTSVQTHAHVYTRTHTHAHAHTSHAHTSHAHTSHAHTSHTHTHTESNTEKASVSQGHTHLSVGCNEWKSGEHCYGTY